MKRELHTDRRGMDPFRVSPLPFRKRGVFVNVLTCRLSLWTAPSQRPSIWALPSVSRAYSIEAHGVSRIGVDQLGREEFIVDLPDQG